MKKEKKRTLFLICICSYGLMAALLLFHAILNMEICMLEMIFILMLYAIGTLSFGIVLSDNETLFVLAEKYEDVDEDVLKELKNMIDTRKKELQENISHNI